MEQDNQNNNSNLVIWKVVGSLLLLIISLIIYSYYFEIKIGDTILKKPKIKEYFADLIPNSKKDYIKKVDLRKEKDSSIVAKSEKDPVKKKDDLAKITPFEMDTNPQRILMIGESMIEQLYLNYLKYGKYNGHNVKAKIWYGSNLIWWSQKDTIPKLIEKFNPTYIMVSIGANELFLPKITERAPYVEAIVEQLKGHKFIWIGPPIPKKDYGIDSMIRTIVGKDRYFTSKNMAFKRRRDGVHPKPESAKIWADSIAVWIEKASMYPIKMKKPIKDTTQKDVKILKKKGKKGKKRKE